MALSGQIEALRAEAIEAFRGGEAGSAAARLREMMAIGGDSLADRLLLADVL